jgi:hypothetical protein
MRIRGALVAITALLTMLGGGPLGASPELFAPPQQPGPRLTIAASTLDAALTCTSNLRTAHREAVLLVAGTGATPAEQYSWNYEPALTALGIPWCAVTVPEHTLGDIQDDAQYLVHAIRTMRAASGRQIAIVGHSQGGMIPRWALRFWPDVRAMVADMVSLAADNHGTAFAAQAHVCRPACPAAAWQQLPGSAFLAALNSPAETFAGIAYTQIYTRYDELSTPAGPRGTSPLHTGAGAITNVEVQDVCPSDVAEHALLGTTDPVGWALVLDAITHPGPAAPSRLPRSVCTRLLMPGVRGPQLGQGVRGISGGAPYLAAAASPFNLVGVPKVTAPTPLRCYVFAACPTARRSA